MNLLTIVSSAVLAIAVLALMAAVGLYALGKIRDLQRSRKRTAPLGEATDWAPVFLKPYQPQSTQDPDIASKASDDKA